MDQMSFLLPNQVEPMHQQCQSTDRHLKHWLAIILSLYTTLYTLEKMSITSVTSTPSIQKQYGVRLTKTPQGNKTDIGIKICPDCIYH